MNLRPLEPHSSTLPNCATPRNIFAGSLHANKSYYTGDEIYCQADFIQEQTFLSIYLIELFERIWGHPSCISTRALIERKVVLAEILRQQCRAKIITNGFYMKTYNRARPLFQAYRALPLGKALGGFCHGSSMQLYFVQAY